MGPIYFSPPLLYLLRTQQLCASQVVADPGDWASARRCNLSQAISLSSFLSHPPRHLLTWLGYKAELYYCTCSNERPAGQMGWTHLHPCLVPRARTSRLPPRLALHTTEVHGPWVASVSWHRAPRRRRPPRQRDPVGR